MPWSPEAQVYKPLAASWWRCCEAVEPLASGDHLERLGFRGCTLPAEPNFLSQLCSLVLGEVTCFTTSSPAPGKEPGLPCSLPPINRSQNESSPCFSAGVLLQQWQRELIQRPWENSRLIQFAPDSAALQAQPFHKRRAA